MNPTYRIINKQGNIVKEGEFSEPEIRMIAKAGYRVYEDQHDITLSLTGLFGKDNNTAD